MEGAHKKYMKTMLATSHMKNMDQVYQGFHSLPNPYKHVNGFEMRMWNRNGTITTPWYEEDFVEEYYKEDRDFHMVLDLPGDIQDQVGSGSLVIELDIDTRDEEGWLEQLTYKEVKEGEPATPYNYTLYKAEKTWPEAEEECKRDGGHIASVTSKELDEKLIGVAAGKLVWYGGRRQSGKWSWSDDSTWEYTKWHVNIFSREPAQPDGGDDSCVVSRGKHGWFDEPCTQSSFPFICQVEHGALRGQTTVNLVYTKEQLGFSSFHVWYKYRAASKQLLESWKEQRMTGFKLSWRIENENPPLIATISEVGRSLQTPGLGGSSLVEPVDHKYKAVLTIPEDFPQKIGNGSLVIELDIDVREDDEVNYVTMNYKLQRAYKTWAQADAHCRSKGGELVSIHSEEDQETALKAAAGHPVWLGGRRKPLEEQWGWSDDSTWDFTNWKNGRGDTDDKYLVILASGEWLEGESYNAAYFLCNEFSEAMAIKKNGLTRLELKGSFFPFFLTLKSPRMSNSSADKRRMSGFTLNWFVEDSNGTRLTEKLPPRAEDWKQDVQQASEYKEPLLADMVQLARKLRMENMTSEQIKDKVIREKMQNISILADESLCSYDQIKSQKLDSTISKLVSFTDEEETKGLETAVDNETGLELFHAVRYCPSSMVIKLFRFVDELLSTQSSGTIIQTFVNLFRSKDLEDLTSFGLAKEFYLVLASTLQLQYGNILLATSPKSQIQSVIDNDWPFFTNSTDLVKSCLKGLGCNKLQDVIQNLSIKQSIKDILST